MTGRRVLFLGTPDFAVPVLEGLVDAGYDVLVVTQPDRPVGRKQVLTPPPVKRAALERGLDVLQPERVRRDEAFAALEEWAPDVLITVAYGQLLPKRLLDLPRIGALNVHASLLPRWRGAAPIHRAILTGDSTTGVTIMGMVEALDAGPMYAKEEIEILSDDTVGTLHDKLAQIGASLLLRVLPDYLAGNLSGEEQPEDNVTYADKLTRKDEFLDFRKSAKAVHNQIRGLSPWPVAVADFQGSPMKIWRSALPTEKLPGDDCEPGAMWSERDRLYVRCSDGWLEILELQAAGKKKMSVEAWLRGVGTVSNMMLESVHVI